LFICKNIIESHEGELWFEDNKDRKGVTFYFTLPTTSNEMSIKSLQNNIRILESRWKKNSIIETNNSLLSHDQINIEKGNQNCNILLVDDDEDVLFTFEHILGCEGYNIISFSDSIKALDHLSSLDPYYYDLIVIDIRMPGFNGFQLYKQIKVLNSDTKVLFLSALDVLKEIMIVSPDMNSTNIIRKPIDPGSFISKIKSMLCSFL